MQAHIDALSQLCPLLTQATDLQNYSSDATEDLHYMPQAVAQPTTAEQVAQVLAYCNKHTIPVYTRGAGTGLCGSALATQGGLVINTQKLNKIIEIDTNNYLATVEPGVINYHFREAVEKVGLFYPPDPASYGTCTLGGNVAHSSGGPKCVKYGTTKDYVLNLQVALPSGELIWTGANTVKNSTGFNLTQLMVGSEGQLGIVTKIVLKLISAPTHTLLMLAGFASAHHACQCVNDIMNSGITPSACELMQSKGLALSAQATQTPFTIEPNLSYYLLVELDGTNMELLMQQAEQIFPFFEQNQSGEVLIADTAEQKEKWWKLRRSIGAVVKTKSIYKEEDTVVPRYHMPQVFDIVEQMSEQYGFEAICYGHAGDGNIHINILKNQLSQQQWDHEIPKAISQIFETCHALGGTISGEHGIGLVQKEYLPIVFNSTHMQLFKGIKQAFDPNGILNRGKWL